MYLQYVFPETNVDYQYCFTNTKQCSGMKLDGMIGEVTKSECCDFGGGAWGRTGSNCEICPTQSIYFYTLLILISFTLESP